MGRDPRLGRKPAPNAVPVDFAMDRPYVYEIRVEGHLAERWSDWFEELAVRNEPGGETTLAGLVRDQAALFGVLNKIQALHLVLVSVTRMPPAQDGDHPSD